MIDMPHTAMLLAAGLGTRMRPLTDATAKPLLEIAGRSMIDRLLDNLVLAGVKTAVVNVHWYANLVEAHLQDRSDIQIVISDERAQLLETGGGLAKARPLLGDDPMFVVNTDAFWEPSGPEPLRKLAERFDLERMDELLLLADRERCLGFSGPGDFFTDEAGALSRRGAAPSAPWAYAGVRIVRPQIYEDLPIEPFSANKVWNEIVSKNRMFGEPLDAFWLHVGDPKSLQDAEFWLRCHGA